jgi:hypothetical protein
MSHFSLLWPALWATYARAAAGAALSSPTRPGGPLAFAVGIPSVALHSATLHSEMTTLPVE